MTCIKNPKTRSGTAADTSQRRVDGFAVHAVIRDGSEIERENGAVNNRRVDGKPSTLRALVYLSGEFED